MSCGVELNEDVILLLCHLIECLLADDFHACIHQKVIPFLHILVFDFEFLD